MDGDEHGNKGIWTENARGDNIYEQDKITAVKGIKEKTSLLLASVGIRTVND